ncbi:hypothetical protein AtubIFM55763_007675 [Aspergillus tubingensis]|uniref:Uncharacterized protein n=1 Tax=Aspergillus tubingensis TaxID=5068 RepID=A0A8H3SZ47_ASPTU|nr:DUF292-domain-containing protein [Aspergillus tubingensis]GFN18737.1 DUF292-domain-containing protein [Aspergillus tubingensis]GLA76109.1 hypothetical protein AtubIFM55763_007675 [Aspergillus tubingensis]GLA79676.1 hypothetical protein AtubIFM56815_000477 [Aspergillus tubingensis]GLA95281.1 hypothetical protein AtubIFM57143_002286 [Aspergillus tubingensis]GLB16549.1 hypothetical protein AtubIFM61612_006400 [Aspergillus tubingensis]
MPPSPQTAKLTSTLHLLIPRLRLLQKKDTASSVVQRRDLSTLLAENRSTSARIRVENVIATDTAVEVMEMVELYCELLLARANLLDQSAFGEKGARARSRARGEAQRHLSSTSSSTSSSSKGAEGKSSGFSFWGFGRKQQPQPQQTTSQTAEAAEQARAESGGEAVEKEGYIDPALDEAAAVIFYSYARFPHDIREMTILRGLLSDRWGKDFMMLAQENKLEEVKVPERLVRGLRVKPPSEELVESYLVEIARAYGVTWPDGSVASPEGDVPSFLEDEDRNDGGGGDGDDGDVKLPSTPRKIGQSGDSENDVRRASETMELNKATPPRGLYSEGKSPVSVAPPGPRVDNLNPKVKVPGEEDVSKEARQSKPVKSDIPELDELTRRFAALRR